MRTILILILFTTTIFAQSTKSDSLKKLEKELWLKKHNEDKAEFMRQKAPALADSFHVTAVLKDFNLGGSCGQFQSAGGFLFVVKTSDKKEYVGKTVMVIMQCAYNDNNFFQRKSKYTLTVTPTRSPGDVLFIWGIYKKYNYPNLFYISAKKTD